MKNSFYKCAEKSKEINCVPGKRYCFSEIIENGEASFWFRMFNSLDQEQGRFKYFWGNGSFWFIIRTVCCGLDILYPLLVSAQNILAKPYVQSLETAP